MLTKFLGALTLYKGTVQDCTPSNAISKVLGIGIDPVNPKPGDTSYMWVNFDLSKDVYGGTATYSYSWNYIPFDPTIVPLCEQSPCPIYAGVQNMTGNSTFPDVSGLVEVRVEWADDTGTPIWCVQTTYTL